MAEMFKLGRSVWHTETPPRRILMPQVQFNLEYLTTHGIVQKGNLFILGCWTTHPCLFFLFFSELVDIFLFHQPLLYLKSDCNLLSPFRTQFVCKSDCKEQLFLSSRGEFRDGNSSLLAPKQFCFGLVWFLSWDVKTDHSIYFWIKYQYFLCICKVFACLCWEKLLKALCMGTQETYVPRNSLQM